MLFPLITAVVIGYLLGSLPFGYLVARSKGINIFEHGSKNPGATNVGRVLGSRWGKLVFFLDLLKGAAAAGWPVLLRAQSVLPIEVGGVEFYNAGYATEMGVVGLLAALIGHCFSCFTGFRGGKGVATSVGGILVLMPWVVLVALGVWVATFYSSRYVSLASLLAAISLPISAYFFHEPQLLLGLTIVIALIVLIRHRANISRLLNGTENRFSKKAKTNA
ncbi:MAG TPA: glycerol-3-phosphate 1-O-acyltransferase PlsY [Opitutaceae bacterium]